MSQGQITKRLVESTIDGQLERINDYLATET